MPTGVSASETNIAVGVPRKVVAVLLPNVTVTEHGNAIPFRLISECLNSRPTRLHGSTFLIAEVTVVSVRTCYVFRQN